VDKNIRFSHRKVVDPLMLQVSSNLRPSAKSVVSNSEFGLNRRMLANEMEAAAAITALLKEQPVSPRKLLRLFWFRFSLTGD
jgi:hypothetical protein